MLINEIKCLPANTQVSGTFVLSNCRYKAFKQKDGHFLIFDLSDKTGKISCMIWDNIDKYHLKNKIIVNIKGTVSLFKNKSNLIITDIKETNEYDKQLLLPSLAQSTIDYCYTTLLVMRNKISDEYKPIWSILNHDVKFCPGGVGDVHHNYIGGLIQHIYEMTNEAESLCAFNKQINRDLLMTGILVHDIGKLIAYNWDIVIEMSDEGRLLGHIAIGICGINNLCRKENIDETIRKKIIHMILSHHGENGSIKPMFLEAAILSSLDSNSATTNHIMKFIKENKQENGNWTAWDNLRQTFYFNENNSESEISIEKNNFQKKEESDDKPY